MSSDIDVPIAPDSHSDLKLPRARSQRRRTSDNAYLDVDKAERRKPIVAVMIVLGLLLAGVVLIVRGIAS